MQPIEHKSNNVPSPLTNDSTKKEYIVINKRNANWEDIHMILLEILLQTVQ